MILFRQEHVAPILAGEKVQTRRLGDRRWKVGSLHQCRTRMLDKSSCFAVVCIVDVFQQALRDMNAADARAEGYPTRELYFAEFADIYGMAAYKIHPDWPLWVVTFKLVATP